jgi:hypothetical protein
MVGSKHAVQGAATAAARLRPNCPYGKDRGVFAGSFSVRRCRSSVVEHSLGKGEVLSSILSGSTIKSPYFIGDFSVFPVLSITVVNRPSTP